MIRGSGFPVLLTLQLAVKGSITQLTHVVPALSKCRSTVKFFHWSTMTTEKLAAVQAICYPQQKYRKLIAGVEMRLNLQYDTFHYFLQIRQTLNIMLYEPAMPETKIAFSDS